MSKFLIILVLSYLSFFSNVMSATANCSGGECQFNNSIHYKKAKTYCAETLTFEEVETNFSYFTILSTGKRCDVFESDINN